MQGPMSCTNILFYFRVYLAYTIVFAEGYINSRPVRVSKYPAATG